VCTDSLRHLLEHLIPSLVLFYTMTDTSQKRTLKKEERVSPLEKNLVTLDTPVEELISILFAKLQINAPVHEYAKKLHDNLIMDVSHLKRITPSRLGKLNLPILLEEELEKVVGKPKGEFTKPLVGVVVCLSFFFKLLLEHTDFVCSNRIFYVFASEKHTNCSPYCF
jgi:hypothetical protein